MAKTICQLVARFKDTRVTQKSVPVGQVGRSVARESCWSIGSLKLIKNYHIRQELRLHSNVKNKICKTLFRYRMKIRQKGTLNSPPSASKVQYRHVTNSNPIIFSESENFLEFPLQKKCENTAIWMNDYVNLSFLSFPFHVKGRAKWQYGPTFTSQR